MTGDPIRLPSDLRRALTSELNPGERVLYATQPDWRAEKGTLLAITIFGLFWSAISFTFFGVGLGGLLGLVPVNSGDAPASTGLLLFVFLFSLPFVAIGCAVLAAPVLGIRKSQRTVHAVTDTRLLNVYDAPRQGAETYPFAKLNFIKRKDRGNGTGNLQIGYGVEKDSDGDPRALTIDWSGIPDVKRAERIIREQAKWGS